MPELVYLFPFLEGYLFFEKNPGICIEKGERYRRKVLF